MRKALDKWEIELFAEIKNKDYATIYSLRKYLDPKQVRFLLIKNEYTRRTRRRKIIKTSVVKDLAKRYDVSLSYIETIIYDKDLNKGKSCVRCGKYITNYWWNRNNGICRLCYSDILTREITNKIKDE